MPKIMKRIWIIMTIFLLAGCFASRDDVDLSKISVGMEKAAVIKILGRPDRVAADGTVEFLEYEAFDNSGWDWKGRRNIRWSFVKIVDDQVESYGQLGDFNSTKDPTINYNINVNQSK